MEKLSTEKREAEDKFKDVYRFFLNIFHDFNMLQSQIFRDSRTVLNLVKNDYEAQEKARIIVAEFPDNVGFF